MGGGGYAWSLSLVFKNNDSIFSTSTELGSTLDSRLLRERRGKDKCRSKVEEKRVEETRAECVWTARFKILESSYSDRVPDRNLSLEPMSTNLNTKYPLLGHA